MESTKNEVAYEILPYIRAFKDGRVERFCGTDRVPPSTDSETGVSSKDVLISPETAVSARLFKPPTTTTNPAQKLPLLVYFHGGGFCIGSPFCAQYHNHLTSLVAQANVIAVSVDYRLAPEHPVPAAYEDSWAALKWVASHSGGQGPEPWLNDYADLQRVFVAGDSAGGNIAHNMAVQAGVEDLAGMRLLGACLVHPGFTSKEGYILDSWLFSCPTTTGLDDPRINPAVDPRLSRLGCSRVLVCVAENDWCRDGGLFYYESVGKIGWDGELELLDSPGEGHVFHLLNPTCENAVTLLKRMASFLNQV